jgi:peptidoglycan/xylan/chitin deacetylase (PgdA/CDA1 family)
MLDRYNVKATFFCVGDNVRKHTYLYEKILESGHQVGNHTFHHLQGWLTTSNRFVEDTLEAGHLIASNLFRPTAWPHDLPAAAASQAKGIQSGNVGCGDTRLQRETIARTGIG